jgi:Carbohydrate binding domain
MENIVSNYDFSKGLSEWNPNLCLASVSSDESSYINEIRPNSGYAYAILTQRTQEWHALEQDITKKVTPDTEYIVSACVRVFGEIQDSTTVLAALKLESDGYPLNYLIVGRSGTCSFFCINFSFPFTRIIFILSEIYLHNSSLLS